MNEEQKPKTKKPWWKRRPTKKEREEEAQAKAILKQKVTPPNKPERSDEGIKRLMRQAASKKNPQSTRNLQARVTSKAQSARSRVKKNIEQADRDQADINNYEAGEYSRHDKYPKY